MAQQKAKIIRFIYNVAFGLVSIALALLFILQVCDIYFNGGESPFTELAIKQHFNKISWVLYLWIALIVVGVVVWEVFPIALKGGKNSAEYTFARIKKQLDEKCVEQGEISNQYQKYQRLTTVVKLVCGVCVGICVVFGIAYLCDKSNFANVDQNKEVSQASLYLLPFVLGSFALTFGVALFERIIVKKQIPMAKQLLTTATNQVAEKTSWQKFVANFNAFWQSKKTILSLRIAVASVGVTLLIYGLATGGSAGVLAKAITICRQCIGLG